MERDDTPEGVSPPLVLYKKLQLGPSPNTPGDYPRLVP